LDSFSGFLLLSIPEFALKCIDKGQQKSSLLLLKR